MKVLLVNSRPNAMKFWGGDTTQVVETHKGLVSLGVEAVLAQDEVKHDLNAYNLVHVFNMQTAEPALDLVKKTKDLKRKAALSTIYWDFSYTQVPENLQFGNERLWTRASKICPSLALKLYKLRGIRRVRRTEANQGTLLRNADLLLPNSVAELEILIAKFRMPQARAKSVIVPNGVNINDQLDTSDDPIELTGVPQSFALMAGSFHPIKGQHRFIQSLNQHPEIPIVCMGHSRNGNYGKYCERLAKARGNTYLLDPVPQKEMPRFYKRAKIHVLPSLRESPGLSSLEAALYGAKCVVGIHAPVQEYFGEDAFICDPLNLEQLRSTIIKAWQSPQTEALKDRILSNFTWGKAAEATLRGYEMVLSS